MSAGEPPTGLPADGVERLHRLRFDAVLRGGHVHVAVWAGTADADRRPDGEAVGWRGGGLGKSGDLVLRPDEWEALRDVLVAGAKNMRSEHPDEVMDEDTELAIDYRVETWNTNLESSRNTNLASSLPKASS